MATHCSVLAQRIPGTGEPGGLPSMGLPRPGQPHRAGLPHPPGWPACPAPLPGPGWALVHLSGTRRLIKPPRKQGQPAGAEEGPLWTTSGFRAFLVPVPVFSQKTRVWAT